MELSELSSLGSGWLAFVLVVSAGVVPLGYRLRNRRRAAPTSASISLHVALGLSVTVAAFAHALFGVMALGGSRAIGASDLAIWAGALALLVLMAHVGIGLQLRNPRLRDRQQLRRRHLVTAVTITSCAVGHVVLLWGSQ